LVHADRFLHSGFFWRGELHLEPALARARTHEARASADRLKTQFTGAKHTTTLAHDKRADEDRDVRIPNDVDAC
jgi:hypothetical protein